MCGVRGGGRRLITMSFCCVIRAQFDTDGQWGNRESPNMLVKQNLLLISNRYSICMGFCRV